MKQTVDLQDFREAFRDTPYENNFSYEGLEVLFNHLEELESDTGYEIELDIVAIACDFVEYADLEDFQGEYGEEYRSISDIERDTTVIMIDDRSFIIENF